MDLKKKIIRNTLISGISTSFVAGLNFLLLPFVIYHLGIVGFGLVGMTTIFGIGGYVSFLEFGFQTSITKYVAEFHNKNEKSKLEQLVSTSIALFFLLGILASVLGLSFSHWLVNTAFSIDLQHRASFNGLLQLIFLSYLFQFPSLAFQAFLEGLQRYDLIRGWQSLSALLKVLAIVVFLSLGFGYESVVYTTLALFFCQFLFFFFCSISQLPVKIRVRHVSFDALRNLYGMSKFLFVGKISSLIYSQTDRVFIGIFFGPSMMSFYEVLIRIPQFLKLLMGFGTSALLPASSEISAASNHQQLRKLFIKGLRFNLVFIVPILVAIGIFARPILELWVGTEFVGLVLPLRLLLLWNFLISFVSFGGNMLVGTKTRLSHMILINWTSTLIRVGVTLSLIHSFKLVGVAIGAVLSLLFTSPFLLNICMRSFGVKRAKFYKEVLMILLLCLVPLWVTLVPYWIPVSTTWFLLSVQLSLWCISYWIAAYFLHLTKDDKRVVRDLLVGFSRNKVSSQ